MSQLVTSLYSLNTNYKNLAPSYLPLVPLSRHWSKWCRSGSWLSVIGYELSVTSRTIQSLLTNLCSLFLIRATVTLSVARSDTGRSGQKRKLEAGYWLSVIGDGLSVEPTNHYSLITAHYSINFKIVSRQS